MSHIYPQRRVEIITTGILLVALIIGIIWFIIRVIIRPYNENDKLTEKIHTYTGDLAVCGWALDNVIYPPIDGIDFTGTHNVRENMADKGYISQRLW